LSLVDVVIDILLLQIPFKNVAYFVIFQLSYLLLLVVGDSRIIRILALSLLLMLTLPRSLQFTILLLWWLFVLHNV